MVYRFNGDFVGRIQGGLRGDERPGANAWVRGAELNGGNHTEQREFVHSLPILSEPRPAGSATTNPERAALVVSLPAGRGSVSTSFVA